MMESVFYDLFNTVATLIIIGVPLSAYFGTSEGVRSHPLKELLRMPAFYALAAGLVLKLVDLPVPVVEWVHALGNICSPLIMISVGLSLNMSKLKGNGRLIVPGHVAQTPCRTRDRPGTRFFTHRWGCCETGIGTRGRHSRHDARSRHRSTIRSRRRIHRGDGVRERGRVCRHHPCTPVASFLMPLIGADELTLSSLWRRVFERRLCPNTACV